MQNLKSNNDFFKKDQKLFSIAFKTFFIVLILNIFFHFINIKHFIVDIILDNLIRISISFMIFLIPVFMFPKTRKFFYFIIYSLIAYSIYLSF